MRTTRRATPGEWLLVGGEIGLAAAALRRACALAPEARVLRLLGDAEHAGGDVVSARIAYRDSLLLDPLTADVHDAVDESVRDLPSRTRVEMESGADAKAWSAPAGAVIGVFGVRGLPVWVAEDSPHQELLRARAFMRALARAATGVIEPRREMKKLSPALFALWLDRRSLDL